MRYVVIDGSQSAHCCFDSTVVDTSKPIADNTPEWAKSDKPQQYEAVCECFEREDAEKIASALNASQ